jgi:hypothetical protein
MACKQPSTDTQGWGTNGNSGITASNFLGTTNTTDLVFKTNLNRALWIDPSQFTNQQVGEKFYRSSDTGSVVGKSVYTLYQDPDYDFLILQRSGQSYNSAESYTNDAVYSIFQIDAPVQATNNASNMPWISEATFALSHRPGVGSRVFVDFFCQEYQEPVGVGVRVQKRGPNASLQNFDFSFSDGVNPVAPGLAKNYSIFSVNVDRTISLFTNDAASNATNRSAIKLGAPAGMTADRTLLFPATIPTASQVLSVTSVAGGVANLGWTTVSGVGGVTSLNGLTAGVQTFSGTDIIVTSAGANHAITINDASATTRGVITTVAQTIAGNKTFSGVTTYTASSNKPVRYIVNTSSALTDTDEYILARSNLGAITITLPSPTGREGRVYKIRRLAGSTNAMTINASTNGGAIDGNPTFNMSSVAVPASVFVLEIISDGGTDWYITSYIQ